MTNIRVARPDGTEFEFDESKLDSVLDAYRKKTGEELRIVGPSNVAADAADEARAKFDATNKPKEDTSAGEAFGRGVVSGVNLDWDDETAATLSPPQGTTRDERLTQAREDKDKAFEDHPIWFRGGQVVGSLPWLRVGAGPLLARGGAGAVASGLNPAGLMQIAQKAPSALAALRSLLPAAAEGYVAGAGASDGKTVADVDQDAGKAAGISALLGPLAGGVVKGAKGAKDAVANAADKVLAAPATKGVAGLLGGGGAGTVALSRGAGPYEALVAAGAGGVGARRAVGALQEGATKRLAARESVDDVVGRIGGDLDLSAAENVPRGTLAPPDAPPPEDLRAPGRRAIDRLMARDAAPKVQLATTLDEQMAAQQAATSADAARKLSREDAIRKALETLDAPKGPLGTKAEGLRGGAKAPIQPSSKTNLLPRPRGEKPAASPVPEVTAPTPPTPQQAPAGPLPRPAGTGWDQLPPERVAELEKLFGPLSREVHQGTQPLGANVPSIGRDPRTPISSMLPPVPPEHRGSPTDIVRYLHSQGVTDRYKLREAAGLRRVNEVDRILLWSSPTPQNEAELKAMLKKKR